MLNRIVNKIGLGLAVLILLAPGAMGYSKGESYPELERPNEKLEYLSPVLEAKTAFTGLVANYKLQKSEDDTIYYAYRFRAKSQNNKTETKWSEWVELNFENEEGPSSRENLNTEKQSTLVNTNLSQEYQYKFILESGPDSILPNIQIQEPEFLNVEATQNKVSFTEKILASLNSDAVNPGLNIISRAGWGANENLLFYGEGYNPNEEETEEPDNKDDEDSEEEMSDFEKEYWEEIERVEEKSGDRYYKWPLEYMKTVRTIVIHHTASVKNLDDPKTAIRNIQYYHAVKRGWGDIGYNYVIDQEGNIYEGRRGGEKVVGGHAIPVNRASIGISVMGNFQTQDLPSEVVEAIVKLTRAKAELYDLDLNSRIKYKGVNYDVLQGHRDNSPTACPGENLYLALPSIRYLAMKGNGDTVESGKSQDLAYLTAKPLREIMKLDAYTTHTVKLKIINTGKETWTQSATFLELNPSDKLTYSKAVSLDGKFKMIEKTVKPGETASFELKLEVLLKGGYHGLKLDVVLNNEKLSNSPLFLPIFINPAELSYKITKEDSLAGKTINLKAGDSKTLSFTIKNTGDVPWNKSGLELGLYTDDLKNSKIAKSRSELISDLSHGRVDPGKSLDVKIKLKAPSSSGTYTETFRPRIKGIDWLEGEDITVKVKVASPVKKVSGAQIQKILRQVFPVAKAENIEDPAQVKVFIKELSTIALEIENKSNKTWEKDAVELELVAGRKGMGPNKFSEMRLAEQEVKAGETGHVLFKVYPRNYGAFEYELKVEEQEESFKILAAEKKDELEELNEESLGELLEGGASSPKIRVLLSFFDENEVVVGAQSELSLELDGKLIEKDKDSEMTEVVVQKNDTGVELELGGVSYTGSVLRVESEMGEDGVLELENYEHRPSWNKKLNDNKFRGVLEVRVEGGDLVVVNELELENYLKGLAEISNSANSEKMKTIIVAARSYAYHYISDGVKFPGKAWDLDDDPEHCQKYLGYGFETRAPRVMEAIEDTFGKVVSYEDKVIKVPYFNQSDGRTRSAEEVWGWEAPYLVSVEDSFCEADELLGHGVGISGCGASGMAEKGMDHEEIIQYFLKGSNFKYVYTRD